MPFVSAPLLEEAITELVGKHPLAVLVLPAMVSSGVQVANSPDDGRPYGSTDELKILNEFFALPGGPPDRPFRAVWEDHPSSFWRDQRYPGRALQRQRVDRVRRGDVFFQKKGVGGPDLWAL